eukprot:scaffold17.g452.t1
MAERRSTRIPRPAGGVPSRRAALQPLVEQDENVGAVALGGKRSALAVSPQGKGGPPRKRTLAVVTTTAAPAPRVVAPAEEACWEQVAEEMGWAVPTDCLSHKLTFQKRAADKAKTEALVQHVKRLRAAGWHLHNQVERLSMDTESLTSSLAREEEARQEDRRAADEALKAVQAELGALAQRARTHEAELGEARGRAERLEGELGEARTGLRAAEESATRLEAEVARLEGVVEEARAAARVASEGQATAQAYNAELQSYNSRMQAELKERSDELSRVQSEKAVLAEENALLRGRVTALEEQLAAVQAASSSTEVARSGALEESSRLRGELLAATTERAGLVAEAARLRGELEAARKECERYKEATGKDVGDLEAAKTAAADLAQRSRSQAQLNANLHDEVLTLRQEKEVARGALERSRAEVQRLEDKVERLESALAASQQEVREGEALRKKLHNEIQELKGNIRVFCRVRPNASSEAVEVAPGRQAVALPAAGDLAGRGVEVAQAAGGKEVQTHSFGFDRVFGPGASQAEVFEEISALVQSSLDGYKVCIFAYGQASEGRGGGVTGSGKTHTMMGKPEPNDLGVIPRAMDQVFATSAALGQQGWRYEMRAAMMEVYNEELRDLLGKGPPAGKKHQVSHDDKGNTSVSYLELVDVSTPDAVRGLLDRAMRQRSVAATAMNEQSSRSHMVFMLSIEGANEGTGQRVRGALNLIDLAGSERLARSGAEGQRLKETQAINKSLSALGDVIAALGNKEAHVPYRNSKLTHLLQQSLGGASSKTLMFVNVAPSAASVGETLCSLRFAAKVNATEIGTARRQIVQK